MNGKKWRLSTTVHGKTFEVTGADLTALGTKKQDDKYEVKK